MNISARLGRMAGSSIGYFSGMTKTGAKDLKGLKDLGGLHGDKLVKDHSAKLDKHTKRSYEATTFRGAFKSSFSAERAHTAAGKISNQQAINKDKLDKYMAYQHRNDGDIDHSYNDGMSAYASGFREGEGPGYQPW